ncbi:hypothetical protein [Sphingomonas sp.]|uniref:hypothetical protein n=1 Tax=Sphingomonas sp. TaxID=28214 RepID=UPI003B3A3B83
MTQEADASAKAVRRDEANGETAGSVGAWAEAQAGTGIAPEADAVSGGETGAGIEDVVGAEIGEGMATGAGPKEGRKSAKPKKAARKRKPKRIAWSARRERIFLETLAQTAKVAAAVRASGLSDSNVYRHRQCDEGFRGRWAAALAEGFERLEAMMLDRALNGVRKSVWYGGKRVGTMTEYSDRTALALLAQHRGAVRDAGVPAHDMSTDEWRAHWDRRFKGMRRRMGLEE